MDMTDAKRLTRFSDAAGQCLRSVFAFLVVPVLYFAGLVAAAMLACLVDSPYPRHAPETSWVELRFVESLEIVGLLTMAVFVAMAVSVAIGKVRGCRVDMRFYPVPSRIRSIFRSALPRTILAVGLLVIIGYLVTTLTVPWLLGRIPYGSFWPAERIFICLIWAWSVMWLAETVVRPVRKPMLAAIIFGVASLMLGCSPAVRPSVAMQPPDNSATAVRSVSDLISNLAYEFRARNLNRIPSWATERTETEHFIYHHAKGDPPIIASLKAQERHYAFFKRTFGIELPPKVHFVMYPDGELFADAWPNAGGIGGRIGGRGYVHSPRWFEPHEAIHGYLRSHNGFLHEGIAEAFGSSFYYYWGDVCDKDFEMSIQDLYERMDRVLSRSRADRVVAHNFIRWLFHRYGSEKLVAALREAYLEGSRTRAVFARIYGVPFRDLAAQWQRDQEWLSAQQSPEGFFVDPPWD